MKPEKLEERMDKMKISNETKYDGEKVNLMGEAVSYYTDISFSLEDVTVEEFPKLREIARKSVYTLGLFGHHPHPIISHQVNPLIDNSFVITDSYSSPCKDNNVKIDYHRDSKTAKVSIEGPEAVKTKIKFRKLMPRESLENTVQGDEK